VIKRTNWSTNGSSGSSGSAGSSRLTGKIIRIQVEVQDQAGLTGTMDHQDQADLPVRNGSSGSSGSSGFTESSGSSEVRDQVDCWVQKVIMRVQDTILVIRR
jgi:hypothetical protein